MTQNLGLIFIRFRDPVDISLISCYHLSMELQDTLNFLKRALKYAGDDSYFHTTIGADAAAPGDAAIGYRVMYRSGDKYISPLIDAPGYTDSPSRMARNEWWGNAGKGNFWVSANEVNHSDTKIMPANLGDEASKGFYYFPDKEQALEYMSVIAAGIKKPFHSDSFIDAVDLYANKAARDVELGLFKVRGTASTQPWDEGAMMNDMTIESEPEFSLKYGDIVDLAQALEHQNRNDSEFWEHWKDLELVNMQRRMGVLTDAQKEEYFQRKHP